MARISLFLYSVLGTDIFPLLDLLKDKSVGDVISINCNYVEKIYLHKILNQNKIKAASLDIAYNNTMVLNNRNRMGIILNTTCADWPQAFNYFPANEAFKSQRIWFIFTENLTDTTRVLSNLTIELDSDVTIIFKEDGIYNLYEIFHASTFVIRKFGYWNNTLNTVKFLRNDLSGIAIRISAVITDKISNVTFMEYLTKRQKSQIDSMHKLKYVRLMFYIRDMFNFSYEIQRTNSWGYVRNGSFDGMVGSLQRNETDVGGSSLFFRTDRAQVTDYVVETWNTRQCFILRHPKHPGGIYSIYTRPLTVKVWYCVLGILVVSGSILYVLLKTKFPKVEEDGFDASFSLALLFMWSAVCQQGMSLNRNSTSVKVVVFVTFVYAVTLYQYYNATVVSTLLREPPKNIRTLEDLLKSNLKAGAEDVIYIKDYFKRTTDQVIIKMYHKKIKADGQDNFFTPDRGMALVKAGGFAFHVDSVVAYRIMRSTFSEREICEAHEITMYPPQRMGLIMRKMSQFKEYFTYGVRRIQEAGLMGRLRAVWDEPKPPCVPTPDTSVFSVSILEFSSPLLALTAGLGTSLLILIAEIATHRLAGSRIVFRN